MTAFAVLFLLSAAPLSTVAEQTHFAKTGRYEEAVALCHAFEKQYPGKARCEVFGTTPEGRPMVALAASADGTLSPEDAKEKGRPVILFQGGIHAGEIDGKDAGFWFLRDALDGKLDGLGAATALFVPVFNVDGHERFSKNNRPNQRGPEEMGFRVTAQNLNLNRDYAKADSPEMAAMLSLLGRWDPIVLADLHVTDGAKFEHDVAILVEPSYLGDEGLGEQGRKLSKRLMAKLTAKKHLPLPFYPSFLKDDDPMSGFAYGIAPPRFSQGYWQLRNRIGILVETHSWRPYGYRVKTTYDTLVELFLAAKDDGAQWLAAAKAADEADLHLGGKRLNLVMDEAKPPTTFDFRGYAFTKEHSDISGADWIRYDEKKPQIWTVPLYDELRPVLDAMVPRAGWVVPAGYAERVAQKLALHGFAFERLAADVPHADVEVFRATTTGFSKEPFEGRQGVKLTGEWKKETQSIPRGSLFIPSSQKGIRLLLHLLEPTAPDSLAAWGFFNAAFEQKEYMESYVAEDEARRLLASNPALKAEFEKKLKDDPEFAKSPDARLHFFYERTAAWDTRKNLVPVYRADVPLR